MDESETSTSYEIVSGASNLFRAFTGASIAAVDPAMATTAGMAGALAGETAPAIFTRVLGSRDRRRVSAVVSHAQKRIHFFQTHGVTIRQDDFWQARGNIPPVGQEVFEAVLVAAQKEPQEQKIPYIGNLFAYIACRPEISDVSAHWLVKTAESLSWTQFELLALIHHIDEVSTEGVAIGEAALNWDSFALHRELGDLGDGEKNLILGKPIISENIGLKLPSTKLADQTFSESGRLLAFALGIEDIEGPRLENLVGRLRRPKEGKEIP